MGIVGVVIAVAVGAWLFQMLYKKAHFIFERMSSFQGPAALPVIGNLHQFHFKPDEFFEQTQGLAYLLNAKEDRIVRVWLGGLPFVMIYGAEETEAILGSNKMLNKPFHYSFLGAWIGEGLLISKPAKWRPRRKLLTPAFHYDILKDFVEVYNRHGTTLVNKFLKQADEGVYKDIFHTVTLCTLDVICEAALGVCLDAQNTNTPYLDAVMKMKMIIFQRMIKPYYYPDTLFDWFGAGREHNKCVEILHEFTGRAIVARRAKADAAGGVGKLLAQETAEGRRRMAFLDLMLDMNDKGELDMAGIQEEVDTFTFEGHDTTSASINWFLHLMGTNPEEQAKVQQEIDQVLGMEDRPLTFEDLGNLKYLEAAIKETLRLYPSVPIFARQVVEDIKIKNSVLPAGTGVVIVPSMVHKDTRYWDDPEMFRPSRFLDGEQRHAYAYIPFSAGSRNCIGQRFAIMEEKCILAMLMKKLKVKAFLRTDEMRVSADLIIRPMYGNKIKFMRREHGDYTPMAA